MCKCVLLPPGDKPTAVNKYSISFSRGFVTECSKVQCGDLRLAAFGKYSILDDNVFRKESIINGDRGKNYALIPVAQRSSAGHGLLIPKLSRSHTTTHHSR